MAQVSRPALPTVAVGQRIRSYRNDRRLTQTELARQIGIQQSDLSRMEQGEYRVSLDVLFKILRAFEISFGEFFGDLSHQTLTTREAAVLESFRSLARGAQQEVIDFIDFKRTKELEGGED